MSILRFSAAVFALLASSGSAIACVCGDLDVAVRRADTIFDGYVVEARAVRTFQVGTDGQLGVTVGGVLVIEVENVYRGWVGQTATIDTGIGSSCATGFQVGTRVFFVANRSDGPTQFETDLCLGSRSQWPQEPNPLFEFMPEREPLASYTENRYARLKALMNGSEPHVVQGSIE